jgi:hypothetical protein
MVKRIKLYENFKVNNITSEDLEKCIGEGGVIYSKIVKEFPDNDPKKPLRPVDIDETGEITIDVDGDLYYVDLDDVDRVEFTNESNKISILHGDLRKQLPPKLSIITSNGQFELELCDCWVQFPKVMFQYWQNTPDKTNDVLSDGEPDYLGFDLNFMKRDKLFEINIENTYGDAMMFEYKIMSPNTVEVGHYNGYKSKHDPNYVFGYTEESINDLIQFFNKFTFGLELTRDKFNFLDIDPKSYKFEKVGYLITNFSKF